MKNKQRLDLLLTERGLAESRARAQAMIMSGIVFVGGQKADKPGLSVDPEAEIEVRGAVCPYVSRGGLKLEKALRDFGVDPTGFVCGDSGASTGGFTDCLLQKGAAKVFSIDVGYGQLAWKLRSDPRVVCMERTNLRGVTPDLLGEPLDLFVLDVSFISLRLVLPAVFAALKPNGVRDPSVHREVLETVLGFCRELGFTLLHLTFSPVKGPEGNIEFLAHLTKKPGAEIRPDLADLVRQAHETLNPREENP